MAEKKKRKYLIINAASGQTWSDRVGWTKLQALGTRYTNAMAAESKLDHLRNTFYWPVGGAYVANEEGEKI